MITGPSRNAYSGIQSSRRIRNPLRLQIGCLERFPITSHHVIKKEALEFKDLDHVRIEKGEQLFRDMLSGFPLERTPPKLPPRAFRRAPHEREKKRIGQ